MFEQGAESILKLLRSNVQRTCSHQCVAAASEKRHPAPLLHTTLRR